MTERPLYQCTSCTATYPSYLAAIDCEEQDRYEKEDRAAGRFFRMHRDDIG